MATLRPLSNDWETRDDKGFLVHGYVLARDEHHEATYMCWCAFGEECIVNPRIDAKIKTKKQVEASHWSWDFFWGYWVGMLVCYLLFIKTW